MPSEAYVLVMLTSQQFFKLKNIVIGSSLCRRQYRTLHRKSRLCSSLSKLIHYHVLCCSLTFYNLLSLSLSTNIDIGREIDSWPLMKSPVPLVVIFVVYLILVEFVLPKFMERRKAYELTTITRCYNIFQVICCMYLVKKYYENGWSYSKAINCRYEPSHETVLGVAGVWWLNTMIRIVEFVETIFFILRKKFNQASFLHIYHHISSIAIVWLVLKYEPSEYREVDISNKFEYFFRSFFSFFPYPLNIQGFFG